MAGAVTLAPVDVASAADSSPQTRTITGHFDVGVPDFVYLPVQVPSGVRQLDVSYGYDRPAVPPGVPGNALDIGIFDQRGHELGDHSGFRGWSGGFRDSFSISNSQATPGYLPGPIEPGTWNVVLGPYTVAPAGLNWTVQITLTFGERGPAFVPDFPPTRAKGRGRAWYRGDCHLHTVYSDGRRLPAEVAAGARARKLDFIVSTDHNTSASHGAWGQLAGDDLLIVSGEEITSRNGHFVAAGLPPGTWIDWRYRAQDGELPRFLRDLHHGGAIAVAAHPFAPCLACAWKFGYAGMDAVEVWNGPWTLDDEVAVQLWNGMLVAAGHGQQRRAHPAAGDRPAPQRGPGRRPHPRRRPGRAPGRAHLDRRVRRRRPDPQCQRRRPLGGHRRAAPGRLESGGHRHAEGRRRAERHRAVHQRRRPDPRGGAPRRRDRDRPLADHACRRGLRPRRGPLSFQRPLRGHPGPDGRAHQPDLPRTALAGVSEDHGLLASDRDLA